MKSIDAAGQNIRFLDELAAGTTVIHRIDPVIKLLTAILFVIIVASFPKYAVWSMLPLVFYPVVLIILANLPAGYLLKRVAAVAPFAVLVGILNPVFDRTPLMQLGIWSVPGGWVSFCSIVLRFCLTVLAALLVIATTAFPDIGAALARHWRDCGFPGYWCSRYSFSTGISLYCWKKPAGPSGPTVYARPIARESPFAPGVLCSAN
jgi:cobalt/nickel transport system permease protein